MSDERRVALVTGGSRGIGALVVRAFAERGYAVVIASRKEDACRSIAEAITRDHGVSAIGVGFNASSWEDCDRLVEAAYGEFGRVDALVNNAGMSPRYEDVTSVTEALFDKVLGVNLRGPFRLMSLVGTKMRDSGHGGTIVNIGSIAALRPDPDALPYSAAKAGLHTLTEGFAQLLGPSVRVNTVHLGPILTEISEAWPPGAEERLGSTVALQRCGEASEVVGAVMYLAGEGASYTTGAALRVDGGWR